MQRNRWPFRRSWLLRAIVLLLLGGCAGEPIEDTTVARPSPIDQSAPAEPTTGQSAPPATMPRGDTHARTVQVAGEERGYIAYVPADASSDPMPLVVLLHGPTKPSAAVLEAELAKTGLATVADHAGFMVALPPAAGEAWMVARTQEENEAEVPWMSGFGADNFAGVGWEYGDEDAQVIMAVLDEVVAEFSIDESRVYSAGVQNGSLMAARMVCDEADRFAALAAMTNGLMMTDPCPANRPVPVIGVGGTQNPFLSGELMERGARLWAAHNGCEPDPSASQPVDEVTQLQWNDCDAEASVVIHHIADVGYEFVPGPVDQIDGYTPAQALWRHLAQYTLP